MTKKLVNIIGINNNEGIHVENPEDVFATLFTESNNEPFLQNTWHNSGDSQHYYL